jgi:succinoglycan biosynthesis transport protein ExoP
VLVPHSGSTPNHHNLPSPPTDPSGGDRGGHPAGPGNLAVPQTLAPTPTPGALFVAFRRRMVLALALGVVGATCTGAAAWNLVPEPRFQARATVHINSVQEKILGSGGGNEAQFAHLQKTQMTLVKSQVVLERVFKDPEIRHLSVVRRQAAPKDWLAGAIEADFKQGAEILTISIKGDEPDDLVVLANAVAKAYLDEFINTEHTRIRVRIQKLQELQHEHETILAAKRANLRRMAANLGGGQPGLLGGLQDGILKQMSSTNEELQTVTADLTKTKVTIKQQEAKLTAAKTYKVPEEKIDREINKDTTIKRYADDIARLEDHVDAERKKGQSRKRADQALRETGVLAELESTRKRLEARRQKLRPEVIDWLKASRVANLEDELEKSREALTYLRLREEQLLKDLEARARVAKTQGEDVFKLSLLAREVEEEDKIVTTATNEIRALRLDLVAPPRAKPLDEAVVWPYLGKKRLLLTIGGAGGVFLLVVLAVALREFNKRKVEFVDEVAHGFGIGIVGTMPTMKRRPGRGRAARVESWSGYIDSFRTLLLRGKALGDVRVLMVTSAEPGEGKTSLSAHLAVSLARSGRKTLLLDGDMRNPTAHRLFTLPPSPGLSEVLTEQEPLEGAIRPTTIGGLWVLPAGSGGPAAFERLSSPSMANLFSHLRQGFDFIVVDSCPVLPVADSLHLAQHADGVIFSVLRRVSRLPKLSAALYRVRMIGAPVLGAVVNGTDEDVYSHGYYAPVQTAEA